MLLNKLGISRFDGIVRYPGKYMTPTNRYRTFKEQRQWLGLPSAVLWLNKVLPLMLTLDSSANIAPASRV